MPHPDPPPSDAELRRRDAHRLALADVIRALRAEAGLSQEALADAAHVSRPTIARIELGTHSLSLDRLWALAEALGVSATDLVRQVEESTRPGS